MITITDYIEIVDEKVKTKRCDLEGLDEYYVTSDSSMVV
jgi:hypothetical protein